MDIKRIHSFRTVVEAGGYTAAAKLLHRTPGALLKSLRQLERETGNALLVKEGRRLRLTEHGSLLYNISAPLLGEHARILRQLDTSTADAHRTLRLATYEVFSTHFLGALIDGPLGDHPLQVADLAIGEVERAVAGYQADVGITYLPVPGGGLTFRAAGEFRFGIFVRRGAFKTMPFDALPFAVPIAALDAGLSDALAMDCWPYERVPRHVKYRLTSMESALVLCRRGLAAVYLPEFVARLSNQGRGRAAQLAAIDGPPELGEITRRVHIVQRENNLGDEPIETLFEAVKSLLQI
jgi:DNA-binding transcriptional LysR family regulator